MSKSARVFFTSDVHLGHRLVAGKRGFASIEDHDDTIAARWRAAVGPDDQVWVLGDIAASAPWHALEVLASLPGRKFLVLGNHDRAHPMNRDAHRWQRAYLDVFESALPAARRRIEGQEVLLSHFPYERDRNEARYVQWRLRDEGLPLLHGHTHGTERLTLTTDVTPGATDVQEFYSYPRHLLARIEHREPWIVGRPRVEVHVGVDAWGLAPVPLETVADLLRPYTARTTPNEGNTK